MKYCIPYSLLFGCIVFALLFHVSTANNHSCQSYFTAFDECADTIMDVDENWNRISTFEEEKARACPCYGALAHVYKIDDPAATACVDEFKKSPRVATNVKRAVCRMGQRYQCGDFDINCPDDETFIDDNM